MRTPIARSLSTTQLSDTSLLNDSVGTSGGQGGLPSMLNMLAPSQPPNIKVVGSSTPAITALPMDEHKSTASIHQVDFHLSGGDDCTTITDRVERAEDASASKGLPMPSLDEIQPTEWDWDLGRLEASAILWMQEQGEEESEAESETDSSSSDSGQSFCSKNLVVQ
jgi:hypothetical protein